MTKLKYTVRFGDAIDGIAMDYVLLQQRAADCLEALAKEFHAQGRDMPVMADGSRIMFDCARASGVLVSHADGDCAEVKHAPVDWLVNYARVLIGGNHEEN